MSQCESTESVDRHHLTKAQSYFTYTLFIVLLAMISIKEKAPKHFTHTTKDRVNSVTNTLNGKISQN